MCRISCTCDCDVFNYPATGLFDYLWAAKKKDFQIFSPFATLKSIMFIILKNFQLSLSRPRLLLSTVLPGIFFLRLTLFSALINATAILEFYF